MNCASSRESVPYRAAVLELIRNGVVFPNGNDNDTLKRQKLSTFVDIFNMAYCLDACEACQRAYSLALTYHGKHSVALESLHSEGWRVMFWYGQRIRIVNVNSLKLS